LDVGKPRPGDPERLGDHLLGETRPAGEAEALRQGALAATPAPVSRRRLLLGAGALTTALTAAAVVVWQARSDPRPEAEFTSVREAVAAPPNEPQPLAAALRAALAVTPMADFTHTGGLSQSSFSATAKGSLVYDPLAMDGSGSVDFTMNLSTPERNVDKVVVIGAGRREGVYLNGREAKGKDETGVVLHTRLIALVASVGIITELVALTPRMSVSGRTYVGSLVTTTAPHTVQDILAEIAGGWSRQDLEKSTLNWELTLDEQNCPRAFELVWRAPIQEAVLASSWTTGYSGWRIGTISPPQ
jgi:hypothetical protein